MTIATNETTTPLLERGLAKVPELRELDAAIALISEALASVPAFSAAEIANLERQAHQTVVDEALAGRTPTPGLGDAMAEFARRAEARGHDRAALIGAREDLQRRRLGVIRAGGDNALRYLGGELERVVAAVEDLDAELGDVHDADLAIATDRGAAWQQLHALVVEYDRLRVAQRDLAALQVGGQNATGQATALIARLSAGLFSNAERVHPELVGALNPRVDSWGEEIRRTPEPTWPAPDDGASDAWWPTRDRASYLRWLATSHAEPWIPTLSELQAELARLEHLLDDARSHR